MPGCAFKLCNNATNKNNEHSNITFHRFPSDPIVASQWIKSVRLNRNDECWIPKRYTKICSVHFNDGDRYITTGGLARLRREAVPIKNLHIPGTTQQSPRINIFVQEWPSSQNFQRSQPNTSCVYSQEEENQSQSVVDTTKKVLLQKEFKRKSLPQLKHTNMIKTLKQKTYPLKRRNNSLKNILVLLQKERYINNDVSNILSENLFAAELFNNLARKYARNKNRPLPKYTPRFRKFCLTLHYHSPRAYSYVRRTFNTCLPNIKTIYNWYSSIGGSPGFTGEAFKLLKTKINNSGKKLICCLVADEMIIRPKNIKGGHGDVDVGAGSFGSCGSSVKATEAYVFLLVCLNERWEIPLGYFLIHGLTGAQKTNLINICLTKCAECGVKVISFTCDGHPTNISAMELLGCRIKDTANMKTTFKHPVADYEIAVFLDSCHMLKLIRNHFEEKKYFLDKHDRTIDWNFVLKLNELQEKDGLQIANKVSRRYLEFRNNIVKIKLATRLLSRSVALSLKFCRETLKLDAFKESEGTEKFITLLNNLFDIFNSKRLIQHGFCHLLFIVNRDEIINYLNECKQYIINLKMKTNRKRSYQENSASKNLKLESFHSVLNTNASAGFRGILICIESLKYLYTTLVEGTHEINNIANYRLSQDHIDLFFSTIRMSCGYSDNPNALQFKNAYRKHLELQTRSTGNCIPLESLLFLISYSPLKCINITAVSDRHDDDEDFPDHLQNNSFELDVDVLTASFDDPDHKNHVVSYIAGNVAQLLTRKIKCIFCTDSMLAKKTEWFHKLVTLRDNGRLVYASKDTYTICLMAENYLHNYIAHNNNLENTLEKKLLLNIMEKFIGNTFFPEAKEHINFHHHQINLARLIIERYVRIRMYINESKDDTSRGSLSKRQLFRKAINSLLK